MLFFNTTQLHDCFFPNVELFDRDSAIKYLECEPTLTDREIFDLLCESYANDDENTPLVLLISPLMHEFVQEQMKWVASLDPRS